MTADIVEEKVNRAFKWLKIPYGKSENGLPPEDLREAANAPTVFNVHAAFHQSRGWRCTIRV